MSFGGAFGHVALPAGESGDLGDTIPPPVGAMTGEYGGDCGPDERGERGGVVGPKRGEAPLELPGERGDFGSFLNSRLLTLMRVTS